MADRLSKPHGLKAYFLRECLELLVVIGILGILGRFYTLPVPVWIGLPLGKASFSVLFYILFLRRTFSKRPHHDQDRMIGRIGAVVSPLAPKGQIKIQGEIWTAVAEHGDILGTNQDVRVRAVEGRTLVVESTREE